MILNGWKEIADHLRRGVRTVQRWESLGLPVRRPRRKDRSAVCALSEEIDEWVHRAPLSEKSELPQASDKSRGTFYARILVVDDDEALLVATAAALSRKGYDVRTARDGFEALAVLRSGVPDMLIADLKLPNMSGFELCSIVRKKYPAISVIVFSGEFAPLTPPLILADRFVRKGTQSLPKLKEAVRELLSVSPIRPQPARPAPAPTWIPRSTNGYIVMTCLECLRPFSVPTAEIELDEPASEQCPHCGENLTYLIDTTVATTDVVVPPSVLRESHKRVRKSKEAIREVIQIVKGKITK